MIYLTGDAHGNPGRFSKKNGFNATEDDIVIVLGDFGLVWNDAPDEIYWRDWLLSKPFTTLFVDGNHENHTLLRALPTKEMFGSKVGVINDKVFHLKRGHIYDIQGSSFLAFGGANSIDKHCRTAGWSWWPEEIPSKAAHDLAVRNLTGRGNSVDYILCHTCPKEVADEYIVGKKMYRLEKDPTEDMLSNIVANTKFKYLYFGHWHDETTIKDKYIMMYKNIERIKQ